MKESLKEKNGLIVGQDVTWRCVYRGGYGFIQMVNAKIIKLNPKTVRIEAIALKKENGQVVEFPKQVNVSYDNIKESTTYVSWR